MVIIGWYISSRPSRQSKHQEQSHLNKKVIRAQIAAPVKGDIKPINKMPLSEIANGHMKL